MIRSAVAGLFALAAVSGTACAETQPGQPPEPGAIAVASPDATTALALTPTPSPNPSIDIWRPADMTTWQWHLDGPPVDQSIDVDMYDIDLFDNDEAVVGALH